MSEAPDVKPFRYSLRPKAGAFDLRFNQNRYGLVRTTVDREKTPKNERQSKRSRSPSPVPSPLSLVYKRKIRLEPAESTSETKRIRMAPVDNNGATLAARKQWKMPKRTLAQAASKPAPQLYDVSKGN